MHHPDWCTGGVLVHFGQSEPAPTSAPMRMDGALMGAPFSSLPVPGLTKVANSSWPSFLPFPQPRLVFFLEFVFFFTPHACPGLTYLPTFKLLPMHPGLLPPSPTYLLAHLPTHLSTYPPIYLSTYTLNLHQGNDDTSRWRYCNTPSRLLHSPSYLPPY
jgi:hypothetical protein